MQQILQFSVSLTEAFYFLPKIMKGYNCFYVFEYLCFTQPAPIRKLVYMMRADRTLFLQIGGVVGGGSRELYIVMLVRMPYRFNSEKID